LDGIPALREEQISSSAKLKGSNRMPHGGNAVALYEVNWPR
jgi:hypothetical protein